MPLLIVCVDGLAIINKQWLYFVPGSRFRLVLTPAPTT